MAARVVCLSRALGAGAEEVAGEVGRRLGFRVVDEEIVAAAAARQGVEVAEVADVEQRKGFLARILEELGRSGGGELGLAMHAAGTAPMRSSDELRGLIREAILETAADGSVVIIAHAASYALAGQPGVLRVLVTGSSLLRAGRLGAAQDLDAKGAEKALRESDAARGDYLRRFYEVDEERPEHYDLVVSTDVLTPSAAAAVIAEAAAHVE